MTGFWIVIGVGVFIALIGYIIIQRREPDEADKIASKLDAAWKSAKDAAEKKLTGDKKP